MNHVYRLVWDAAKRMLVAVSEIAGAFGKGGASSVGGGVVVGSLSALALALSAGGAWALPTGAQIVAGQAQLSQSGNTLNVQQSSQNAILNWQSFGIGANETVNFLQPGASSVALNRVIGADASSILGHLHANGQVFLVNPNGITFAPGAQVNAAGLAASTLGISNQDFLAGNYHFSGDSTATVLNQGQINALKSGYVALIGKRVDNQGSITADGGAAVLGAGSSVALTLSGNQLLSFEVSGSALDALAQNGGLIQADGGQVILSAQARDALLQTVVNNSGTIRARTVDRQGGVIKLLGGDAGSTQVSGTLDASAPQAGNGGFIETSGQHLDVADGTVITTKAANGEDGQWLIDPNDFIIAASGGSITGAALNTALNNNSVIIQTTSGNAVCSGVTCPTGTAGNGDIFVNDTVSWTKNTLTLNAYRNININTAMNGSGTAGLALKYGQGATDGVIGGTASTYNVNAPINLASTGSFSTQLGSSGAVDVYTIITALGSAGSATGTDLQGMNGNLAGKYVLGANIDASATSSWNSGAGFAPVGTGSTAFTGVFDGLGHKISNLTISRPSELRVGLFGYASGARMRNLALIGGSVTGGNEVGALAGHISTSTISNAYATGAVSGTGVVGGLVGYNYNYSTISNAYALGTVSGRSFLGGLVGYNNVYGVISNSYATGAVSGSGSNVGGLVGRNEYSKINNAYATGAVSGTAYVGGLAGKINYASSISNAYATGVVVGSANDVGGLVGYNGGSIINNAYATGAVTGSGSYVGGLVGSNDGYSTIANAYATGAVTGGSYVGGLVGSNYYSVISNAYAMGSASGNSYVGGLVGYNLGGTISTGYATGKVGGSSKVGALLGAVNGGTISNAYWDSTTNTDNALNGNGIGSVSSGTVTNTGSLTTAQLASALPSGFSNTVWGNLGNTVTPYLLANSSFGTVSGAVIRRTDTSATPTVYGLIQSLTQLQNINSTGLSGSYLLGANLDAGATSVWNAGAGFLPIGNSTTPFSGIFEGAGNTISNLYIKANGRSVGLFGKNTGTIRNLGLVNASVSGGSNVGALVGSNAGTLKSDYASGLVSAYAFVGGLVGANTSTGTISSSYSSGSLTGGYRIGGLVSSNQGLINGNSYASGSYSGSAQNVGGLVGYNNGTLSGTYASGGVNTSAGNSGGLVGTNGSSGVILSSSAQGNVTGGANSSRLGGLVGYAQGGTISGSYARGNVATTGSGSYFGGLIGQSSNATLSNSYATGTVSGAGPQIGGLVGQVTGGTLSNVYATGAVTGGFATGGLAGQVVSGAQILSSYATGTVAGINGGGSTGGLVGFLSGATVSGAYASGAVNAVNGGENNGGLVGQMNSAVVSNSYATGAVTASSSRAYAGGLVGVANGSTLSNVYATGNVAGAPAYVGGLLGGASSSLINSASAWGSVTGGSNAGGLVGFAAGATIRNAYASGAVSAATARAGGLIGNVSGGAISNVYAIGSVRGSSNVGGLIGSNGGGVLSNAYATGLVTGGSGVSSVGALIGGNAGTVSNAFWDSTTDTTAGIAAIGRNNNPNGVSNIGSKTTAQLAAALPTGFDSAVWGNGGNQITPYLLANAGLGSVSGLVYFGSDSSATPVAYGVIGSLTQLQNINTTGLSRKYVLGASIDASATSTWNNGAGFAPLGSGYTPFSGVLDGLGQTISNLRINRGNDNNVGLFAANAGTIRNLGLVGGSVAGAYITGAMAGSNRGTITNAFATSTVVGGTFTGGLVGANSNGGYLDHTYAGGAVSGTGQSQAVGGLVGGNDYTSTIQNSYATGTVSASASNVGGLAGQNVGFMTNTHASGDVYGTGSTGGLVGANYALYGISNSYATGNVSGTSYVGGLVGYNAAPLNKVYASGSVTGADMLGGLAGFNDASYYGNGSINDAYASGAVMGSGGTIGGLLGYNSNGVVSHVYATGRVSGNNNVGGLIGSDNTGIVSSAYWDTQTTGQASSAAGQSLSHAQAQQQASYGGFDFSNTWVIYNGHTAPLLRSFLTALTITADNTTQTYTGSSFGLSNATYSLAGADTSGHLFGLTDAYNGAVHASSTAYKADLWSDQQGYLITVVGGSLIINPKTITLTGSRSYDGSSTILGSVLSASAGSLIGTDTLTITGSATLAGKNAGTQAIADQSGLSLGNSDYTLASTGSSVTIDKATLTLNAASDTKIYDGTTASTGTVSYSGLQSGDTLSGLSQSFGSKNVLGAGNSMLSVDSAYVLSDGNGGNNYVVTTQTAAGTITPATLTLSNLAATDKVYDAKTTAAATASLSGVLADDEVSNTLSASFADKNVGQNKTVTVSAVTLGGTDAGNYQIVSGQTTTASITPATLTLSNLAATDKVYDAKTTAAATAGLSGVLADDEVSNTLSASFADKNVGQNKTVTVSAVTLGGADAGNYQIDAGQSTTANVTAATLIFNAVSDTKVYDGNKKSSAAVEVIGLQDGDSLSNLKQFFDSKNVQGEGKSTLTVNKSYVLDDGNGGQNYIVQSNTASGSITPATLTLNAVSDSKTYDGARSSTAAVQVLGLQGTDRVGKLKQLFDSRNVLGQDGSTLRVVDGYVVADGNNGGNYTVVTNTATGTITPATLTLSASSDSKVYDATRQSSGKVQVSGLFGNDRAQGLVQTFDSRNVLGKDGSTLSVAHYNIVDGNGGNNYQVVTQTATGTITPATLTLSASSDSKVYDGTRASLGLVSYAGLKGNDSISNLSQSFLSKNVLGSDGSTLQVNLGYTLADGSGGRNYVVVRNTATGTITPATLTLSAVRDTKTYDGTTDSSGVVQINGLMSGDQLLKLRQRFTSAEAMGEDGSTLEVSNYQLLDGNRGQNYVVQTETAKGTIEPKSSGISN